MRSSSGRTVAALLLAVVLLGVAGCGREPAGPTPAEQVQMLVADLPDAAGKPDRVKDVFAAGAAPPDAQQAEYRRLTFRAGEPSLSGDSGTVPVTVEDASGTKLGEVEWSVTREGDRWKLKSAPLP